VAWVTLGAAGSEVVCSVRSRSLEQRDELLLRRLPSTTAVLDISAYAVLHRFAGSEADWLGYGGLLGAGQIERLGEPPDGLPTAGGLPTVPGPPDGPTVALEPGDQPMLDLLAADGRVGYAALAAATGWTESRVTRRLDALQRHGIVYFDLDVATTMLGFTCTAYLWLTVEPARLGEIGAELASHPEVPFAAAVSGTSNLLASVVCRDIEALYVSGRIGTLRGVRQIETSPELRRVKQAGSLLDGPRLAQPAQVG
jgi:DNA-binding Lrp family transcriptional regulator